MNAPRSNTGTVVAALRELAATIQTNPSAVAHIVAGFVAVTEGADLLEQHHRIACLAREVETRPDPEKRRSGNAQVLRELRTLGVL